MNMNMYLKALENVKFSESQKQLQPKMKKAN